MKTFQIYLLRGGEILSNIDVKQYEFNELSRKSDIKSAIESMLFVSGEALPLREISNNLELREKNVVEILQEMTTEYEDKSRGIRLISLDEAYQLVTKSENSEFVQKLLKKNKKHSLSQASIESLAIIAYKQPITRIDIDEIRGVKSESAITRLVERGLIKDVGRLEVPGRPILYGTTDEFLRQFGLKTIKELPSLDLYGDEGVQSSMDLLNKAIEDIDLEENNLTKLTNRICEGMVSNCEEEIDLQAEDGFTNDTEIRTALIEQANNPEGFQERFADWSEKKKKQFYILFLIWSFIWSNFLQDDFKQYVCQPIKEYVVAKIREFPNKNAGIVGELKDEQAIVTGDEPYYYKIMFIGEDGKEHEGFVSKRSVILIEDADKESDTE